MPSWPLTVILDFILFFLVVRSSCAFLHGGQGSDDEVRLLKDLFDESGYNSLIRPVKHINETLLVNFSLALSQLINIDEKNQQVKSNVWLQLYWIDYQLTWDKDQYGGIDTIRLPPDKIWAPDIVLFNNADGNYEPTYKCNCVIEYDGNVKWIPPAIYKSSCEVDVKYFPFDQQECEMKFGSWTFPGDQLQLGYSDSTDKAVVDSYVPSGTWDLIKCPALIETVNDTNGDIKTMMKFTCTIRRKSLFYTINLIIPCVLISFVSMCVFALPADAGEKITLCISILVALVVFMLLVSKILPSSLTIPLISKYLLFTFIMNVIAILITVIIINNNYRTPRTHDLSHWVRLVFLNYLPRILMVKRPDHEERWVQSTASSNEELNIQTLTSSLNRADLVELREIHHPNCKLRPETGPPEHPFPLSSELHKTAEGVNSITQHLNSEDEYETVLDDWKYVALVLDRLLLYIFLVATILGTGGIFIAAPHIFEIIDQDQILIEWNN